jgi:hypothetical protein
LIPSGPWYFEIYPRMTNIDPDEIKIALGEEGNIWPQKHSD